MNAYQKLHQLASQVTDQVIAELLKGKAIWQQPWGSYGLPKNYFSGRAYEGFNALYLHFLTERRGFTAPYFLTYRQARELGGHVRKGQQGMPVVYWKVYGAKAGEENQPDASATPEESTSRKLVPFLWTVFNIDQVVGVDFSLPEIPDRSAHQCIASCQQVVEGFPAPRPCIRFGGGQAWYAPALDMVRVPELRRFASPEAFHATLFHELVHATGHPSRLNRFSEGEQAGRFGDEAYSKEELVAEMGASFLCAYTGIQEQVFHNSVAYLQGWVSRLRDDKTMLLYAAGKAFRAASYILGLEAASASKAPPGEKGAA
ncbi:antirestriction protein ArdC [Pontibacter mucosus]|uniref:Antirestriction protein ArdC n=1 Tax=Pontibacter mucosus TaxID=1649266 RepID=A0A2T5YEC7_9BACT|nr:zincin-like metallopeptidase domain-containing protein [Pontibacter mucosus]PTX15068.1 antirestriction protein ArdC [Pontibacter mucosus]